MMREITTRELHERIEELEDENVKLRDMANQLAVFNKRMHDDGLKTAKDIIYQNDKAVAKMVLHMRFGTMSDISFCEIFDLKENERCEGFECCTDCMHEFLKAHYREG